MAPLGQYWLDATNRGDGGKGDSIKTWLNGVPAADLKNDVNPSGFIALQVHGVGKSEEKLEVRFRKLRLQELP